MSEIKKIKEQYFSKLNEFLDQNKLNEIKTELLGKNGIISKKFKQLGSIPEEKRKKYATELNLLKTVWGEGFLSPGGTDEIDEVMKGVDASGKAVLDIGCGCGGAAIHLIKNHGANSVVGLDIESLVIQRANELAVKYNLSNLAHFRCVKPGPLDILDKSVDLVFSKEVFLHISNKDDLLKDIYRVLKSGGLVAVGDWMRIDDNPPSIQMQEYIAAEGLDMYMCSLKFYEQ